MNIRSLLNKFGFSLRSFLQLLLVLVPVFVYFVFRPRTGLFVALIVLLIYLVPIFFKNLGLRLVLSRRSVLYLGALLVLLYMVFCYFYFRVGGWDGMNLYIKNVVLLRHDFQISFFGLPQIPYLAELVLAALWRFGSLGVMNLSFGIASVFVAYTSWYLFRLVNNNPVQNWLAMLFMFSSPAILYLVFFEFKVELFLLVVSNIALIVFVRILQGFEKKYLWLLLGFVLALGVLIKILYLPYAGVAMLVAIVAFYLQVRKIKSVMFAGVLLGLGFLLPILIWALYAGISLPIGSGWSYYPARLKVPGVEVKYDIALLNQCRAEAQAIEDRWFVPAGTLVEKVIYPFKFLFNWEDNVLLNDNHTNPGPFVALAYWLYPIFYFACKIKNEKSELQALYFLGLIWLGIALIIKPNFFWYAIVIMPLTALFFAKFVHKLLAEKVRAYRLFLAVVIAFMVYVGVAAVIRVVTTPGLGVDPKNSSTYPSNSYLEEDIGLSRFVDEVTDGYVLNTTRNWDRVFLTFAKTGDERVIGFGYDFFTFDGSLDDMYIWMVESNIKYIAYRKLEPTPSSDDIGACGRGNLEKAGEFIEKYMEPIYFDLSSGEPLIFRISESR